MEKDAKIYVSGHRGLVGSAIVRKLKEKGYANIITRSSKELDLTNQADTLAFFKAEKPDYVFLAAAKVGGIMANQTYPAEFIYRNLMIDANVIHSSYLTGVKKLLNLGSSCIYPRLAPQPMKEDCLLTSELEKTNEAYALAKIAAIKMCRYYNEQYGTNYISVMPTNQYGAGDNFNMETAHLLQKLEDYEGICILATNLISNIDEAFKRRIKFMVNFAFPTPDVRLLLWNKILPKALPCEEDIDFAFFAEQFELSGSSIKEILTNAAFLAAAGGRGLKNEDIVEAIRLNFAKYGRVMTKEDFGYLSE